MTLPVRGVRVPADTLPTVLDTPRTLPEGHPARAFACPACTLPILGRPMVTVYVGTAPGQRRPPEPCAAPASPCTPTAPE